MATVTIKNLKTFESPDGGGFNCSIYLDGKKIGTAHQGGHGGPDEYYIADDKNEEEFSAALRQQPSAVEWMKDYPDYQYNIDEIGFGDIVNAFEDAKWLRRHLRTKVLYRLPGDGDDSWRTVAHRGYADKTRALIVDKYGSDVTFAGDA